MRRVLVISIGYPHPSKGASSVVFFHYLRALRKSPYDVTHLLLVPPEEVSEAEATAYLEAINPGEHFRVHIAAVPRVRHPTRAGLVLRPAELTGEALALIQDTRPDVTLCFDIHATMIARRVGLANLLVWLGDLAFQTTVYHALYDVKNDVLKLPSLAKSLLASWIWKKSYRSALYKECNVIVSSGSSVATLASLGISSKYQPYPWPANGRCHESVTKHTKPTFIMFGTLSALGSRSAFDFLIRHVHPLLIKKWGSGAFTILIAGSRQMPEWVESKIMSNPEYRFLGFVDDLASEVCRCHAVLAPIAVPVGNRSRILTAMAMRTLVIAHANTALGNPELISGKNCLLARSAKDFAKYMVAAFEQPQLIDSMGSSAAETYIDSFEPERASQGLIAELGRIHARG